MALYEYQCDACGQRFERIQRFSDPPPEACANCSKGPVRRLLSSPAIQFKGAGWYITDYARKGGPGSGASGDATKSEQPEKSGGGDAAPASGEAKSTSSESSGTSAPAATPATAPAKPAN